MGRCPLAIPLAVLIAIILISDYFELRRPQEPPMVGYQVFCADILDIHEAKTSGRLAIAKVDSVGGVKVIPFKTHLRFLDETPILTAGQSIKFGGDMRMLEPPIGIPDAIDLNANLRKKGVTAQVTIADDSVHYIVDTPGIYAALRRANAATINHLHALPLSNLSIEMLSAMLLGNGEYLTLESREIFSAAGLSHILALSGMHVGVITMIITIILWPLYFSRHLRTRLILGIIILWAYAAFTGFIPSVTRAVIMTSVYLMGRILQRKSVSINSLCLAGILILIFSPSDLYSLGFQLSFAAVAGIIIWFPIINRINRRKHPWIFWLVSIPSVSISAMIFSGFVSVYHFHQFPVLFIVANIVVTPLVPIFIMSGILSIIFSIKGPTDFLASAIDWVARLTSSCPFANFPDIYLPLWYVICTCALLLILALSIHYGKKFIVYETMLLIVGISMIRISIPKPVYPQEEAFLIKHPSGEVVIERIDNECRLYSSQKTLSERMVQQELYEQILRDYMALRRIDSIRVMPFGATPVCLIEGKSVTLQK